MSLVSVVSVKILSMDTGLYLRRISSPAHLLTVVGAMCMEQLKTCLFQWRALDGLRAAGMLKTRDSVIPELFSLMDKADSLTRTLSSVGKAILLQGAESMALTLKAENDKSRRTESNDTVAKKEMRYVKAYKMLIEIAKTHCSLFGASSVAKKDLDALKDSMEAHKPVLLSASSTHLQDEANGLLNQNPRNESECAGAAVAAGKRGGKRVAQHGLGVSPSDGKKQQGERDGEDADDDKDLERLRERGQSLTAKLNMVPPSGSNSDSLSTPSQFTELAMHTLASSELKNAQSEKLALEARLAEVQRKLDDEIAAHNVTKTRLSTMVEIGDGKGAFWSELVTYDVNHPVDVQQAYTSDCPRILMCVCIRRWVRVHL